MDLELSGRVEQSRSRHAGLRILTDNAPPQIAERCASGDGERRCRSDPLAVAQDIAGGLRVESRGPVGRHALPVACKPCIELLENAGLAEPRLGLEDDHLGSLGSPYPDVRGDKIRHCLLPLRADEHAVPPSSVRSLSRSRPAILSRRRPERSIVAKADGPSLAHATAGSIRAQATLAGTLAGSPISAQWCARPTPSGEVAVGLSAPDPHHPSPRSFPVRVSRVRYSAR